MKYVLDASVAVKWELQESDSAEALSLLDDIDAGLVEVVAPNTFPIEVAHALTKAERRGIIPPGEASLGLTEVMTATVTLHDSIPFCHGRLNWHPRSGSASTTACTWPWLKTWAFNSSPQTPDS